jgi:tetratricopeptide (TPR) repeat protein
METPSDPEQSKSAKAKLYFTIAIVLLFVLALMWSVDGSFFYLISGPIVFFFYLGFRNLPKEQEEKSYQNHEQPRYSNTNSSFGDEVESFIRKKQADFGQSIPKSPQSQSTKRFVIGCIIVVAIFSLFFIPLVISIFASEEITYYEVAEQYYNSGSLDSAYLNYEKASKEDATDDRPFIGMGNAALEMNRLDSAVSSYEMALSINPDNSDAQYKKGLALYYQAKYEQAAQTLTNLFQKDPTYFDALQKLGDVHYDQKRYDEALKYYDQAYANGIRNNWICYVSGYLYEMKGNTKKAVSLYREALSYDSTVVDIYARLGTLLPGSDGDFFRRKAAERGQQ